MSCTRKSRTCSWALLVARFALASSRPHPAPLSIGLLATSWAGDVTSEDLSSGSISSGAVDFVNVNIASDTGMACDTILVSPLLVV